LPIATLPSNLNVRGWQTLSEFGINKLGNHFKKLFLRSC